MKSVLISIKPKWCELIASGEKTIEVRMTRPEIETPFKCYISCTKDKLLTRSHLSGKIYVASSKKYQSALERNGNITLSGKVIGEFVFDKIEKSVVGSLACDDVEQKACMSCREICGYFYGKNYDNTVRIGYGWHISDLKIYDKPKELSEFSKYGFDEPVPLKLPPQSWMYVEVEG